MSSEQDHSLSSSASTEETDDISLTFWIFLWTFLAIIASWIYTKLNHGREIVEDSNNIVKGPEADEQIARKLVNEISKNDLVKRSTFRRQRSYEIIDGEVRIHYDVSWAETNRGKKNYSGNNIMDLAEVDSFPPRRSSMEEMELIVPGNLPRIIEEGEEALEISQAIEEENIIYARAVSSEKICQVLDRDIPVINVLKYEDELNSAPDIVLGEEHELTFTKHVESRLEKNMMVLNNIKINVQAPQAEQTNIPKITKTEAKKDNSTATEEQGDIKPAANAFLENNCNSSSDEISSTSEESIIMERLQNTQTSHPNSVDRSVATYGMKSTTSSVYKMTEVAANEEHSFTVTRREITKTARTEEDKCSPSDLSKHYTSMAAVECLEKEKPSKHAIDAFMVKDDTSCQDGRQDKNVHSKLNNDSFSTATQGQNETGKEEYITVSIDDEGNQRNPQARNLHKPEIADKWHLAEETLKRDFEQVGVAEDESDLNKQKVDNVQDFYNRESKYDVPERCLDKTECFEDEFCTFRPLEDSSDIFIDNSGDFLFKVIRPSQHEFLEDIDEVDEYERAVGNDSELLFDENENYEIFEDEVELSKSWKSLPSWEKVHHIHHPELDRDADDSDVECSDNEETDGNKNEHQQMIKSEEIIRSNIEPFLKSDPLESAEFYHPDKQHFTMHRTEDVSSKQEHDETVTITDDVASNSEIISVEIEVEIMEESEAYQPRSDHVCTEHNQTNGESFIVAQALAEDRIINDNLKNPEEIMVNAIPVKNETTQINNNISEQDGGNEEKKYNLVEATPWEDHVTPTEGVATEEQSNSIETFTTKELKAIPVSSLVGEPKGVDDILIEDYSKSTEDFSTEVECKLSERFTLEELKPLDSFTTEDEPRLIQAIATEEELKLTGDFTLIEEPKQIEGCLTEVKSKPSEDIAADNNAKPNEDDMISPALVVHNSSHGHLIDNPINEVRSDDSDDEVIVAYSHEDSGEVTGVIYAHEFNEDEKIETSSYRITGQVVSHENPESKTFKETSLDCTPLGPVKVMYMEDITESNQRSLHSGTDVDSFSDIDEIDIYDIEPGGTYIKSKSVTDLDEALASYGGLQYPVGSAVQDDDDDKSCIGGLSKSVPDILDSFREESFKEVAIKTNSNTSLDSLTESVPRKNLSVSSPEITALQSKVGSKRITKIKIVHVKFLEMQDCSGSENTEEDSFVVDGDIPISGKMKRKSRNVSPGDTPTSSVSATTTSSIYHPLSTTSSTIYDPVSTTRPVTSTTRPVISTINSVSTTTSPIYHTVSTTSHVSTINPVNSTGSSIYHPVSTTNSPMYHSLSTTSSTFYGQASTTRLISATNLVNTTGSTSPASTTRPPIHHTVTTTKPVRMTRPLIHSPPSTINPLISNELSTASTTTKEIVNEHFTEEKTQEKQLEFGVEEQPSSLSNIATSSTEIMHKEGKYVARYGIVPPQLHSHESTTTASYQQPGMKFSDTFQMPKEETAQHKRKPPNYQDALQNKHKNIMSKTSRRTTGHLVRVKSGVIHDFDCSSDADSEMSYNTPSPRMKSRKIHRTLVHDDSIDSASSSEPDSPRRRGWTNINRTTMSQVFGVESDHLPQSNNMKGKENMAKSSAQDPKLLSRFGHLHEDDPEIERRSPRLQQQEWQDVMRRTISPTNSQPVRETTMFDEVSRGSNRSMEFNPFEEVENCDDYHVSERSHSPTSIYSDQSSVFSFDCDFDPMPPPSSTFQPEIYTCENPLCHRQDILLGPEKTSYKSCPACFTYYCCSQCRKLHWPSHKQICYFGRVNTYVKSIIRLCQRRQDLSMYLSQLARDGYKKKGRGVVMATFNSPELAREFITKGHDAFSGRKPTFSSLAELNREGIISKHRVALMQAVRDYEPNEEFVFNIAVVAVQDIPITPAPRYKLNTVLHCVKMPLNEKIVARQPKQYGKVETRLFALPKCSRHEFVNETEARRHYCRNLSKNLRQYNIKLKEDYQDCYKKLCMYVEHDISFEPMTVFGQRSGLTYKCIIAPEQTYPLNQEYC